MTSCNPIECKIKEPVLLGIVQDTPAAITSVTQVRERVLRWRVALPGIAESIDVDQALALNDETEIMAHIIIDIVDSSSSDAAFRRSKPLKLVESRFHVIDLGLIGLPSGFVFWRIRPRSCQGQVVRGHYGRFVWEDLDRGMTSSRGHEEKEADDSHTPVNT